MVFQILPLFPLLYDTVDTNIPVQAFNKQTCHTVIILIYIWIKHWLIGWFRFAFKISCFEKLFVHIKGCINYETGKVGSFSSHVNWIKPILPQVTIYILVKLYPQTCWVNYLSTAKSSPSEFRIRIVFGISLLLMFKFSILLFRVC